MKTDPAQVLIEAFKVRTGKDISIRRRAIVGDRRLPQPEWYGATDRFNCGPHWNAESVIAELEKMEKDRRAARDKP